MATYKVIQDIEAEDKLLGPLTLRQFIYACIVAVLGFIAFNIAQVNWLVALPLVPPILFFAMLAAPLGRDQPTEVWLLAKIRFYLKPKRRIWDQTGIKELVTITAPKKLEQVRTKNFSQTEVKSRLKALADTIDSRGWAIKNVNANLFAQPVFTNQSTSSDRLIDINDMSWAVADVDIRPSEDMLDSHSNPVAQKLDQMIVSSSQTHRQQVIQKMTNPSSQTPSSEPPPDYWFLHQNQSPSQPDFTIPQPLVVAPGQTNPKPPSRATPEEQKLLEKIRTDQAKPKAAYGHMKTIDPAGDNIKVAAPKPARTTTDPSLSTLPFNNDLSVDTIARQANRKKGPATDEVVVPLR